MSLTRALARLMAALVIAVLTAVLPGVAAAHGGYSDVHRAHVRAAEAPTSAQPVHMSPAQETAVTTTADIASSPIFVAAAPASMDGSHGDCPGRSKSKHTNHPGCCIDLGYCASGCSGVIAFSEVTPLRAAGDSAAAIVPLPAAGITLIPSEPPPRSSV